MQEIIISDHKFTYKVLYDLQRSDPENNPYYKEEIEQAKKARTEQEFYQVVSDYLRQNLKVPTKPCRNQKWCIEVAAAKHKGVTLVTQDYVDEIWEAHGKAIRAEQEREQEENRLEALKEVQKAFTAAKTPKQLST